MKQVILIATFLLFFVNVKAQIGDVQQKGNIIISYEGSKEVGRFSISSSDELLGFSSTIIVVKKSSIIISYDARGKEKGRFSIFSKDKFKNVNGNTIYIIKGKMLIAYEVNGKEISRRSL
jgi:hypothetical protein